MKRLDFEKYLTEENKDYVYRFLFNLQSKEGSRFNKILIAVILFSISIVVIDSFYDKGEMFNILFLSIEWIVTILFAIEYTLRIWVLDNPRKYIFSFYGIVDLLALLPSILGLFFSGSQYFIVIRMLRLLRIFRIFKLTRYTKAGRLLLHAIWSSKEKIVVFVLFVFIFSVIIGTLMYAIEDKTTGFTDIPTSIYWAIVTLTTVGYGDISPVTALGKFLSSIIMILGYAIIAVPTGFVTSQMIMGGKETIICNQCHHENIDDHSHYCSHCGHSLHTDEQPLNKSGKRWYDNKFM